MMRTQKSVADTIANAFALCLMFAALLAAPSLARAEEAKPPPPIPTSLPTYDPQELKRRGEAIIAAGDSIGLWEAVPNKRRILLRHPPSGLVCSLNPTNPGSVMITPLRPRGEDVVCQEMRTDADVVTLYATKQQTKRSVEEELAVGIAAIKTLNPNATAYTPAFSFGLGSNAPGMTPLPDNRTASFSYPDKIGVAYTKVSVAIVNGWTVKMRYTHMGNADSGQQAVADLLGGVVWTNTLSQIATPPRPEQ